MAAIKCDICGGSLSMDSSGDFALCDSCGMRHTKDRVKSMAQEVTGTVAVSNIAGIESLMKRGYLALEDGEREQAEDYFGKVLDIDAEYAPAYIGKLCVSLQLKNENDLTTQVRSFNDNPDYIKALRFAGPDYKPIVEGYHTLTLENNKKAKLALAPARERFAKYKGCISSSKNHVVGLRTDGTVIAAGKNDAGQCNVSEWQNIVAIAAGGYWDSIEVNLTGEVYGGKARLYDGHTVGLRADGTVVATGGVVSRYYKSSPSSSEGKCNVSSWRNIVAICASDHHTVGLKSDGTVVATHGELLGDGDGQCNVSSWRNIIDIAACKKCTFGLTSNGKIVSTDTIYTVPDWSDIVAISAYGDMGVEALKSDGTVVWSDKTGNGYRFGLKNVAYIGDEYIMADGTVASHDGWHDIVAVGSGIGVTSNGSVVVGDYFGLSKVKEYKGVVVQWKNIGPVTDAVKQRWVEEAKQETLRQKEAEKRRRQEEAERQRKAEEKCRIEEQVAQWVRQGRCRHCGGQMSGVFTKKCKSCGR